MAAQLAVAGGLDLVLAPSARPATSIAANLRKRGVRADRGAQPAGACSSLAGDLALTSWRPRSQRLSGRRLALTTGAASVGMPGAVVAGTNEASDDMDQWVQAAGLPC